VSGEEFEANMNMLVGVSGMLKYKKNMPETEALRYLWLNKIAKEAAAAKKKKRDSAIDVARGVRKFI
jgi:hypothetical protein